MLTAAPERTLDPEKETMCAKPMLRSLHAEPGARTSHDLKSDLLFPNSGLVIWEHKLEKATNWTAVIETIGAAVFTCKGL